MEKDELKPRLLMIAGSAGSLDVLLKILPEIDYLSFAIVIVVHRGISGDSLLTELLKAKTSLPVKEIEDKEPVLKGHIYLAPADYHLLCERDFSFSLDFSEKVNFSRPSIDVSFESGAGVYGSSLTCILLSGANNDGIAGLKAVNAANGTVIVQKPETAEVPYMPAQAILHVPVHHIFTPGQMVEFIRSESAKG